ARRERGLANLIAKLEDAGNTPKIFRERHLLREPRAKIFENGNVRVPESIDRLLRVADHAEVLETRSDESKEDSGLNRIRILEFVDHHEVESFPIVGRNMLVRESAIRAEFEVVKVERSAPALQSVILLEDVPPEYAKLVGILQFFENPVRLEIAHSRE